MATNDSGLQLSMRLLLGIIAGLLISDLLKALVLHFRSCHCVQIWLWPDALIATAAALFLFRVVADNMLYYADPDPLSSSNSYSARVLLVLLDLCSYAFCYDIVSRLDPAAGPISEEAAYGIFADVAVVEGLHWLWSYIALDRVRSTTGSDRQPLLDLLWSWRLLSGAFAVMWLMVWIHLLATPRWPDIGKAALLATLSGGSALAYLVVMQRQYLAPRQVDQ
jgi:hypothetical protein